MLLGVEVELRDTDAVRLAAAAALGKLGDRRALPALTELARQPNPDFAARPRPKHWAVLLHARCASALLVTLCRDTDAAVRRAAALSLGKHGPAAVEPLRALRADPDSHVRKTAEAVLRSIG